MKDNSDTEIELCTRCGLEIMNKNRRVCILSHPFHKKCFTCKVCDFQLTDRTAFLEDSNDSETKVSDEKKKTKDVFCYSHRCFC